MKDTATVVEVFNTALDDFIERVKADTNIIAGILFGSLVSGKVWEKSDIDLILISKDETKSPSYYWLVDGDILLQVSIQSRSHFRRSVDRSLESSQLFHLLSTSKLLFSKDESLTEYITNAHKIGERDRNLRLMSLVMYAPFELDKVRKSLYIENDNIMAFRFLLHAVEFIARADLVLNCQIPGREFLQQALECNPQLFQVVYRDLIEKGVTRDSLEDAVQILTQYLEEHSIEFFKPVMDYIIEEGGHVGSTQLDKHFLKRLRLPAGSTLMGVYEWLANQDILQRMPRPIRLTRRSRQEEMEAAYYYSEDDLL
ncbi:MAG: nucleotidyltransferase domain-containing protein [Candidatus Thorarchaeota archaeon]|jgi:predicted nucleotidyltransferase